MSTLSLAADGVFHTLQGEGHLLGQPMTFVRLAGCSVGCAGCDTDYRKVRRASVDEIMEEIRQSMPIARVREPWVWITGGEPADQDIAPLVRALKRDRFSVAVATSGIKRISVPVDWLSVSPHGALSMRWGNEIKIVPGLNGLDAERWIAENDATIDFWLRFLQPLEGDDDSIEKCLWLQSCYPHWGVTLQAHKIWNVP